MSFYFVLFCIVSSVVQFYIRFGCVEGNPVPDDGPVLLQYSSDGGVSWTLLAELAADPAEPHRTQHVTLGLPGTLHSKDRYYLVHASKYSYISTSPDQTSSSHVVYVCHSLTSLLTGIYVAHMIYQEQRTTSKLQLY